MSRVALMIGLFAVACNGSDAGDKGNDDFMFEIADQPLQGKIHGVDWTFEQGNTDSFLDDEDSYFATFYSETYEACGFSSLDSDHLIVSVPTEVGTFDFTTSRNGTFVWDGSQNEVTFEGTVRVDEITDTEVTGGLHMVFGEDSEVDGTFTLSICVDAS